jgi:hypothetical protein
VQSDVIPIWIPASGTQFSLRYLLSKYKAQSTAFCVAQIFMSGRRKYMRRVSVHPQVAENNAEIIRLLDEKDDRLIHRATKPVGDPTPP